MVKKSIVVSFIILLLTTLSACGCSKKQTAEPVDNVEEVTGEDTYQYPLTGLSSRNEVIGRAVAVVINNHPKARPQSGIEKADIVYELLSEGNVTRFLAIFQSERPERVGPVRSARDYYIELAKGYDSFFVAHGYSPNAYALLQSGYIDEINGMQYDGNLFKRASDRQAPHNSYITFANIIKGGTQKGYDLETPPSSGVFLTEEEMGSLTGDMVSSVNINYSSSTFNVKYTYDQAINKFKRFSNGEQTVDHETGEPVLVDNLFIVETKHQVIDQEGRRTVDLTSGGSGYLFQMGTWNEVEWKNVDGKIVPFASGKQVAMVPGKTWVNFVPDQPGLGEMVTFE